MQGSHPESHQPSPGTASRRFARALGAVFVLLLLLGIPGGLRGTTLFWDATSGNGVGGSGDWFDFSSWNTSAGGEDGSATDWPSFSFAATNAVFAGTGGTVSMSSANDFDPANFLFQAGNYLFTGSPITLDQSVTVQNGTTGNITFETDLARDFFAAAPVTITNDGAGVLTFNGTLVGSILSPSLALAGNGTMVFNGAVGDFFNGDYNDVTKNGTGNVTFAAGNEIQGTIAIQAGILRVRHAGALGVGGADANRSDVSGGAAIELGGGLTIANEKLWLRGTGVSNGGAFRATDGTNAWNGRVVLQENASINADSGASITFGGAAPLDTQNLQLQLAGDGGITVTPGIANFGGLVVSGAGNRTITGAILGNDRRVAALLADGRLDTGFASGTGANGTVRARLLQPDGQLVIGGEFTSYNGSNRSRIARLNPDGSLDSSFNPGTGANGVVHAIARQSNGALIIAGEFTSYNGSSRTRVARVLGNATLDTTFDAGVTLNGPVYAAAVQSDGSILLAGNFTAIQGSPRNRLVRLTPSGSVDTSFDLNLPGPDDAVRAIALQSDGNILIGGDFANVNGTPRARIARLIGANGTLDLSFDPGSGASASVRALTLRTDGSIWVAGDFTSYNGTNRNRIALLSSAGSLNGTFDPGSGPNASVLAVTEQPDGKLLIAGEFTSVSGSARAYVARLLATGALDTGFDPGPAANNPIYAVELLPGNRTFVAGSFTSGDLIHNGTGTLALGGNNTINTFTGRIFVNGGSLSIASLSNLGNDFNPIAITNGTLRATENISSIGNHSITLSNQTTLEATTGATLSIGTLITGVGANLTKTGNGTATLGNGNNSFGGAGRVVRVLNGTLRIGSDGALGNASNALEINGGTLLSTMKGIIAASRTISLGPANATITATNETTIASIISGNGGFTKNGSGFLRLDGVNSYNGITTVAAGELRIWNNSSLGAADGTTATGTVIKGGGTLYFDPSATIGNEQLTLEAGSLVTNNNNPNLSWAGPVILAGNGTIRNLGGGNWTFSGPVNTAGFTLTADGRTLNFGGNVTGGGRLVRTSTGTTGTLTLSGNNSLGALILDKGTVALNGQNIVSDGNALTNDVTLAVGTTLQTIGTAGSLQGASGIGVTSGQILLQNTANIDRLGDTTNLTFNGGTFSFLNSTAGAFTETIGNLSLASRSASFIVGNTGAGNTTLTLANLTTAGGTINFSGNNLGNTSRVFILGSGNGAIGGWATFTDSVGAISFANYSTATGIGALSVASGNSIETARTGGGLNARPTADDATLSVAGAINTLTLDEGIDANLNGFALRVKGGGIIKNGSTGTASVISNGSLTAGASANASADLGFIVQPGRALTVQVPITNNGNGTVGIAKLGTGNLTLNATSTYSGGTNLSSGNLLLAQTGALPSGTDLTVALGTQLFLQNFSHTVGFLLGEGSVNLGNATLTSNTSTDSLFQGNLIGTGGFAKLGNGTLSMTLPQLYTGNTTVGGGRLVLSSNNTLSNSTQVILDGGVLDTGGLNQSINLLSGGANGRILLGQISSSSLTLTNNTVVPTQFDGAIDGLGSLNKNGSHTLILGGNSSYSGLTTLAAGTLNIRSGTALGLADGSATSNSGSTGTTVLAGATLEVQGGINVGDEALRLRPSATPGLRSVSGNNIWGGVLEINDSGGTTGIDVATGSLELTRGASGAGGGRSIAKTGNGTLIISNDLNGLDGTNGMQILAGTVRYRTTSNISATIVSPGASVEASEGILLTAPLTLSGTGVADNGAFRNVSGENTWRGDFVLAAPARVQSDAGTITFNQTTNGGGEKIISTNNASLTIAGSGNVVLKKDLILGTGNLVKVGNGTLTLGSPKETQQSSSNYTGTTFVNQGTLLLAVNPQADYNAQLGPGLPLGIGPAGTIVSPGGTFAITGGIRYSGHIVNQSQFGFRPGSAPEDLTLSGNGHLGTGALRSIAGNNMWGGNITLAGDILVNVEAARLDIVHVTTGNTAFGSGALILGSYNLSKTGAGALNLYRANSTFTGAVTILDGVLGAYLDSALGNASNPIVLMGGRLGVVTTHAAANAFTTSRAITLAAIGGGFDAADLTTLTVNSSLSGAGGLRKTGNGTVVLAAASGSSFMGLVEIDGGILSVSADNQLGNSSNVILLDTGTLQLNYTPPGNTTFTRNITVGSSGGAVDVTTGNSVTFANVISGSGFFKKSGTGVLVLAGPGNTYQGPTYITGGGMLAVGADNQFGTGSAPIRIDNSILYTFASFATARPILLDGANSSAQTFNVDTGTTFTLNGSIFGEVGAGFTKTGNGTLRINASGSYEGIGRVQQGNLLATNGGALGVGILQNNRTDVSAGPTAVELQLDGNITISSEWVTLNGPTNTGNTTGGRLRNLGGNNTWGGTIFVSGSTGDQEHDLNVTLVPLRQRASVIADAGTLNVTGNTNISGRRSLLFVAEGNSTIQVSGAVLAGPFDENSSRLRFAGNGTVNVTGAIQSQTFNASLGGITTFENVAVFLSNPSNNFGAGMATTFLIGNSTLALAGSPLMPGNIEFQGGILASAGNFTRPLGTSSGQIRFETTTGPGTGGGFAAYGGPLTVNIGNATAQLVWRNLANNQGTSQFLRDNSSLKLGSRIANDVVTWLNPISLAHSSETFVGTRDFNVVDNPGSAADLAIIPAVISSSSSNVGLAKSGNGILALTGANTYNGTSVIRDGTLRANKLDISGGNSSLGNTLSAITLGGNGTTGTLEYTGNTSTLSRALSLTGGGGRLDAASAAQILTVTGGVSGSGNFTIGGAGSTNFTTTALSHNGSLVKLGNGTALLSVTSNFTGSTSIQAGTLRVVGASNRLPVGTSVTLLSPGILDLAGNNQTITGLSGNGTVLNNSAATNSTLTVNQSTGNSSFPGTLASANGSLALVKTGTGLVELLGNNTFAGNTTVSAGTLRLTGSVTSPIQVGPNGTLAGTGLASGAVTNNGTVAPGSVFGALSLGSTYSQSANASLTIEIGGRPADTNLWDRIVAAGSAALNGVLNIIYNAANSFTGVVGDTWKFLTASSRTGNFTTTNITATGLPANTALVLNYVADGVELKLQASGVTYASWAAGYSFPGGLSAPGDDPDKDGLTNLEEYAFGLNPTVPDAGDPRAPAATVVNISGTDYLAITYKRPANGQTRTDLTYTVQRSTTLSTASWSALGLALHSAGTVGDLETLIYRSTTPLNDAPSEFLRLYLNL